MINRIQVLFVCLGNICRSPAAEGVLREMAAKNSALPELVIRSCGMGSWHIGQYPHDRMQEAAKARGITLSSRAQQFKQEFFNQYDYILAADHEVLNALRGFAHNASQQAKLYLFTDFSSTYKGQDIPDPYFGNEAGFELVLDMIEDACEGLLVTIQNQKKMTI